MKNKRGLELVTSRSSGNKTSSKKIPLLVMYYLTKFLMMYYKEVFEIFQKLHLLIYAINS